MVYQWKPGAHIKVSAQLAGEVCENLEAQGKLTPEQLLEVSRDENAPLHSHFEWNDSVAAEGYRREQAAHIIRCLAVKPEQASTTPVRAFFTVSKETRVYESVNAILSDEEKKEVLFQQALAELTAFKAKYSQLKKLSKILADIENIITENAFSA